MHTIRGHFNENILNITEVEVKYLLIIKAKQMFKTPGYKLFFNRTMLCFAVSDNASYPHSTALVCCYGPLELPLH